MSSFSLMRVAGIRIVVDPTWLIIFALVVWSLATGYFPPVITGPRAWVLAGVAALLLFASVLIHELSHALVARRHGIRVPRIRLFLFGGVSEMTSEPHEPRAELRIAAAGPLTSLVLAAIFGSLAAFGPFSAWAGATLVIRYLAAINLALAIFNLLPGFPLDGGRIVRAWLWSRRGDLLSATRSAARAGSVLGFMLIALGLLNVLSGATLGGLWMALIGYFLHQTAQATYQTTLMRTMLSGVKVAQLMTRPVVTVSDYTSLTELAEEYFYRHPRGSFPVVAGDSNLVGMVSLPQLKNVPQDEWPRTPVRQIMTPASPLRTVHPDDDCIMALERMMRGQVGRLPVTLGGRLVGMLSRSDVLQLFKVRTDLAA